MSDSEREREREEFNRCVGWMAKRLGALRLPRETKEQFVLRVFLSSLFRLFPDEMTDTTSRRYHANARIFPAGRRARLTWTTGGFRKAAGWSPDGGGKAPWEDESDD